MKNIRTSISYRVKFFRRAKYLTKIDDCLKKNVHDSVIDSTLHGVKDILKITLYSQIEDELEKQHEEY